MYKYFVPPSHACFCGCGHIVKHGYESSGHGNRESFDHAGADALAVKEEILWKELQAKLEILKRQRRTLMSQFRRDAKALDSREVKGK